MGFVVFLCIGVFRGRREGFASSLTIGLGGTSLESTHFLNHIIRKRKKSLCLMLRQEVLVLSLIFRKENIEKFRRETCMQRRQYEGVRKAELYPSLS